MINIWTLPPEANLLQILSKRIGEIDNNDQCNSIFSVPNSLVFMPTRRSCRLLEKTFLQTSSQKSVLLPSIMPIGDPNIELLPAHSLSSILQGALPPSAKSSLQQEILATELLQSLPIFKSLPWHQCLSLSQDLLGFYETITTQGINPSSLQISNIVPDSSHGQHQIQFLEIFLQQWPQILKENNLIDRGSFRYKILHNLSTNWLLSPPEIPIFAIISAGWIPPVMNLLQALLKSPKAEIWIHGAPTPLPNDQSLKDLSETHPFSYLKIFCQQLGILPSSLRPYPYTQIIAKRSTILLPVFLSKEKKKTSTPFDKNLFKSVNLHRCSTQEEEAQIIALSLRETLDTPLKTAALVTPDRTLAKRVQAHLQRWNISVDDSAGKPLNETPFAQVCLQTLDLLKPTISFFSFSSISNAPFIKSDLKINSDILKNNRQHLTEISLEALIEKTPQAEYWSNIFLLKKDIFKTTSAPTKEWVIKYLTWIEAMIEKKAWQSEEGNAFIQALQSFKNIKKILTKYEFFQLLNAHISQQTFRTPKGDHPRLFILGLREARLIHVDKIILSSLNEGSWPSPPMQNMWQFLQIQKELGLPTGATKISHDGFDFWVNINAAPEILLTRCIKNEQGPTIPARWLNYLQLYLEKHEMELKPSLFLERGLISLQEHHIPIKNSKQPVAIVTLKNKPNKLSVTQLEKFLKDPYLLYCQKILSLHPLPDIDKPLSALDFGILVHAALEKYTKTMPLPPTEASFLKSVQGVLSKKAPGSFDNPFWRKRLERLATWIIPQLKTVQENSKKIFPELWANLPVGNNLTLFGKIDRLDYLLGDFSIIDYKTGTPPTQKAVIEGKNLQLPLEAILATAYLKDKNPHLKTPVVHQLAYWFLHHQSPQIISFEGENLLKALEQAHKALQIVKDSWLEEITIFEAPDICSDSLYTPLERQQEWKK